MCSVYAFNDRLTGRYDQTVNCYNVGFIKLSLVSHDCIGIVVYGAARCLKQCHSVICQCSQNSDIYLVCYPKVYIVTVCSIDA